MHPDQISEWKQQLLEPAADVFGGTRPVKTQEPDLKVLHAKIGQLTLENDFLDGALTKAADDQPNPRPASRSALPDPALARSTAYY